MNSLAHVSQRHAHHKLAWQGCTAADASSKQCRSCPFPKYMSKGNSRSPHCPCGGSCVPKGLQTCARVACMDRKQCIFLEYPEQSQTWGRRLMQEPLKRATSLTIPLLRWRSKMWVPFRSRRMFAGNRNPKPKLSTMQLLSYRRK